MITLSIAVLGQKMSGSRIPLDVGSLSLSTPHRIYELEMIIQGDADPQDVANSLSQLNNYVSDAEPLYIEVQGDRAVMQLTGSPFAWVDIFEFLPTIFGFIGVVLILFTVYEVIRTLPSALVVLIIIGGFMALVLPNIVTVPWGARPRKEN